MAQIYGGRWKGIDRPSLGKGGQGDVLTVMDLRSEWSGELALKRVVNPARHTRFRHEIEAIKRLAHPNIIRLIDHSALDDTSDAPSKQFLVMPLAAGGDL